MARALLPDLTSVLSYWCSSDANEIFVQMKHSDADEIFVQMKYSDANIVMQMKYSCK